MGRLVVVTQKMSGETVPMHILAFEGKTVYHYRAIKGEVESKKVADPEAWLQEKLWIAERANAETERFLGIKCTLDLWEAPFSQSLYQQIIRDLFDVLKKR